MKKSVLGFVILLFSFLDIANAQTTTYKLQYDSPEAVSIVSAYTHSLKIDNTAAAVVNSTCVANGSGSRCTTPTFNLTSGTHTIVVTLTNSGGVSASGSLNYIPPNAPASPVNIQVVVTITVP